VRAAGQGHRRLPGAGTDAADAGDDAAGAAGKVSGPFCPQAVAAKAQTTARTLAARAAARADGAATLDSDIVAILPGMTPETPASGLSDSDYQAQTRRLLDAIEACVDRWLQDDVIDIDTHRTGGLLELSFPNGSKIIVNTQPPLHEVWLAAKAGGFHYRWQQGRWVDTRDGSDFLATLSHHASVQAGKPLVFDLA
jgi:CyaY protein